VFWLRAIELQRELPIPFSPLRDGSLRSGDIVSTIGAMGAAWAAVRESCAPSWLTDLIGVIAYPFNNPRLRQNIRYKACQASSLLAERQTLDLIREIRQIRS
jgi:hypothetical protein